MEDKTCKIFNGVLKVDIIAEDLCKKYFILIMKKNYGV